MNPADPPTLSITVHDVVPEAEGRLVDDGIGESNLAAAPLGEVAPLSCFARLPTGAAIGGAVGRTWGRCAELQQLWVKPEHRRRGIGARLVLAFEQRAIERGCRTFYLETFSFQAPAFYLALGYTVKLEITGFSGDITKYVMVRDMTGNA